MIEFLIYLLCFLIFLSFIVTYKLLNKATSNSLTNNSDEKSKTNSVSFRNNKQENENNNLDVIKLDDVSKIEQSKTKNINNNNEKLSEKSLEQITRITKVIDQTLDFQILLSSHKLQTLPEDDFVIGYLLGYSDSIQQWNDINVETTVGVTIMAKTFVTQFGKERGLSIWRKHPLIGESSTKDLLEGAKIGGQDMHNFLMYGSEYSPMNLNAYLTGEEIYFKPPPKNS